MKIGHNLYRQAEGWTIEFQGDELKVERRGSRRTSNASRSRKISWSLWKSS